MNPPAENVVFLVDVDNTLLDNDRVIADLYTHLGNTLGATAAERYRTILETLREELGYVDYLGALQRYRLQEAPLGMSSPCLLQASRFLIDYPFADRLYPGALDGLQRLRSRGRTVILSDGDVVFQPRKVERSGLWDATEGEVLIYVHKELVLDAVAQLYPARHYVMIDDKLRILSAMKATWGDRLTTVFVRQGHYAMDTQAIAAYPDADMTIDRIGDLVSMEWPQGLFDAGAST
ncbi:HAD family hydrolase [Variovorax ginsengisoli]|uniref:FMN phosphatase YigB (HAD superfamily) n=1 Tax=Variovorax ginsengisoli TaxID=363844 RepID=A0ABT9S397_9BURK|nr:HAD family hydrolase [Variovorax ginsengisoli]MDP9898821.1 FMN phosphatase YigB (HAD superfamily) [Variovorax ginsengisoli]